MITNKAIGYTGRLANQIIQHATLVSVGIKNGYVVKLPAKNETIKQDGCYDFANNRWVAYKLDLYNCFDLGSKKCSDEELNEIKYVYNEHEWTFNPNIFNVKDSTSIEGYFQSEKYFIDVREEILKEFKFKSHIIKEADDVINQISNKEIVSIHVRRGDNVTNPTFPLIGLEYIGKALEYFTNKDYNFLIVSDDINWCKDAFQKEDNVFFSEGHSNYVDLCIMSKCHHNIISNSSFSWWAAWSNINKDKKVIAPSTWFKPHIQHNQTDMYCKGWIVI
jgi:hypothetical protein